eukprot:278894-Pyramimonas_sp.AAC.1
MVLFVMPRFGATLMGFLNMGANFTIAAWQTGALLILLLYFRNVGVVAYDFRAAAPSVTSTSLAIGALAVSAPPTA